MGTRLLRALLAVLLLVVLLPIPSSAAEPGADWAIPGGRYFTQAGEGHGGFAITDNDGIPFWTAYQRFGGPRVLGYPASRRFVRDGFVYQATQAVILQWQPHTKQVVLANVFEMLERAGHDEWLASRGIPRPIADDGSNGDFQRAVEARLGWLTEPAIAQAYFAAGPSPSAAIERYGLPSSRPERWGPFVAQRFQRITLQLWVDSVPGMPPPGSVVPVLAGDLAKEAGLIPAIAVEPEPPPLPENGTLTITDPVLEEAIDLLRTSSRGSSLESDITTLLNTVSRGGTRITFTELGGPLFALFLPSENTVYVNTALRTEDRRALAAVLYHELSHAYDHWTGRLGSSPDACFDSEFFAFQRQAHYWHLQFGQSGRVPPRTALEQSLNRAGEAVLQHPVQFVRDLLDVYGGQCGVGTSP